MPLTPEELQAARLESMLAESRMPRAPRTESHLTLRKPEHESPKDLPRMKTVTERPYLEKNKRYKTWSLR